MIVNLLKYRLNDKKHFAYGKKVARANWAYVMKAYLLLFAILFIFIFLMINVLGLETALKLNPYLMVLIGAFLEMVMMKMLFDLHKGNKNGYLTHFDSNIKMYFNYLITKLIFAVTALVGLIMLFVPGIIFMIRCMFCLFLAVDLKKTPIDALKGSYKMTKGLFWDLLLFILKLYVLNIIGLLCFGIGLLYTIPYSLMAVIDLYHSLKKRL